MFDFTPANLKKQGITLAVTLAVYIALHYLVPFFAEMLFLFAVPGYVLAGPFVWPVEYGGKPKSSPPKPDDKNKRTYDVVIIGGGPAGLAASACLKDKGVDCIAFERDSSVAASWSRHYERLHLHTDKGMSHLPYIRYADNVERYPTRNDVYNYMQGYRATLNLNVKLNASVQSTDKSGDGWVTTVDHDGETHKYSSKYVVIATGENTIPIEPTWPGKETFKGKIVHTLKYLNGEEFRGKKVLVVGCGNSGAEIAVDLWEHGAKTSICVRSGVNIMPRDIFGMSSVRIGWLTLLDKLPWSLRIHAEKPFKEDMTAYGIPPDKLCIGENIWRNHRSPLMDVGTVPLVKNGELKVFKGIKKFLGDGSTLEFVDGKKASFDVIILATGSKPCFKQFLKDADNVTDEKGYPIYRRGEPVPDQNLYFIGYADNLGRLREMGIESEKMAKDIAASLAQE